MLQFLEYSQPSQANITVETLLTQKGFSYPHQSEAEAELSKTNQRKKKH